MMEWLWFALGFGGGIAAVSLLIVALAKFANLRDYLPCPPNEFPDGLPDDEFDDWPPPPPKNRAPRKPRKKKAA